MHKVMIHLVGDSTLDNRFWLLNDQANNVEQAKASSVEGQLQTTLGDNYEVVSHAYSGFTTKDILDHGQVGGVFFATNDFPRRGAYDREKVPPNSLRFVSPLQKLQQTIQSRPSGYNYVILSMGGADFLKNLYRPHRLLWDISQIQQRYLQIVDNVRAMGHTVRPILMFQYRIDAALGALAAIILTAQAVAAVGIIVLGVAVVAHKISLAAGIAWMLIAATIGVASLRVLPLKAVKGICQGQRLGMTLMGSLMEKFYKPIVNYARLHALPILDLPNTFNPYDDLYLHGTEPNAAGGQRIAQGLANIVRNHTYMHGLIYREEGDGQVIPQNWQVAYANPHVG